VANYDARINITANASQADRELQRLQGRLEQVERAANLDIGAAIRLGGIQRSIATVNQLDRAVSSLRSTVRTINSPGGGNLGDAFRTAAAAANQFFDSLSTGERFLSNSIAGLKEQASAFATLAGNISSAEARFVDYVQGAQSAQDKGLRPLFRQFEALRALYEEGVTGRGVEINTREMGAGLFEQLSREVPQTEAALKAFSTELQRVRSLIGSESIAAFGIEQQIIEIEQQLLTIEQDRLETRAALNRELSAPVQSSLARMQGREFNPFGISDEQINESLNIRAEQIADMDRLWQALSDMGSREVNWASAFGISEAEIAAIRAKELEEQWIKLDEAAQKIASQAPQAAAALQAFKFETLAKDADAYTRALLNQQRTLDEYTDSANRAAIASAELGYGGELPALRPAGFTNQDVRIKNLVDDQTAAAKIVADLEIDLDKMVNQFEIENIERQLKAELDRIDTILDARTKAGEKWWAEEKKKLDEKTKLEQKQERQSRLPFLERRFGARRSRAISEGLVGGAFPLLFGQGIGAAALGGLGGAAGGFAGGGLGFGLSLVGTALGTAFDTAVQGATELGDALNDTSVTFDKVKERALFSSKETEKLADKLQEAGLVASASIVAQQEVLRKIGVGGAASLKELGESSDRLNRAWAEFNLQLQAALAGPMADLLNWVAGIVEESNKRGRREAETRDVFGGLSPEQQKAFNTEVSKRLSNVANLPEGAAVEQIAQIRKQVAEEFAQKANIQVGVKVDQIDVNKEEIARLTKELELVDIGKPIIDQYRSVQREQKDLDKQRADLVRSYEESIAQIRKGVEDRIFQQRRQNAQTEIDIRSKAADLQLEKIKQANNEFRGLFSDTLAGEATERLLDAVETVTSIQNQGASERASLELQIQNTAIDTEKYKLDVADQVSKLNEETARRVADIDEQVRRKNEEFNSRRFAIEKQIADLQLKIKEDEAKTSVRNVLKQFGAASPEFGFEVQTLTMIQEARKSLQSASAPAQLRGVGQVGGGGVSAFGLSQAVEDGVALQRSLQAIGDQIRSINSAEALFAIDEPLKKQIRQTDLLFSIYEQGGGARSKDLAAEVNLIQAINDKLAEQTDKTSTLAEKLRELRESEDGRYKIITLINQAAAAKTQEEQLQNVIDKEAELRAQIDLAKSGRNELSMVDQARLVFAQKGIDLEDEKTQAILRQLKVLDSLKEKLNEITAAQEMQQELFDGMAGAVAGTFSSAFDLAIRGSENLGEALKGLAADILATISKMLIMYAIAQALGALGGNDKGVGIFSTLARAFGYKEAANGAYFSDGVAAFANGGMFTNSIVSSPTLFKFADGGVSQMGLMGEAGPEAIMPLKRGPGGRLGVDASGAGGGDNINVVVNVDAKGTNVQGNDQQGNQLGRVVSAAVLSELIKQKRPGGLLA
jgi:hypothetical protein